MYVKIFKDLTVTVYGGLPEEVGLSDNENGWKYNITLWKNPKQVAFELRKIADWLDTIKISAPSQDANASQR